MTRKTFVRGMTALVLAASVTACGTTGRIDSTLQDYETHPAPVQTPAQDQIPAEPEQAESGVCFSQQGVETWRALSDLAHVYADMADTNAGICREIAGERDELLEAGRKAEEQAQSLSEALRRHERWAWWERAGFFVLGILIAH